VTSVNRESAREGEPRVDASMTLLTEVMQRPLDPSYQAAADRKQLPGHAGPQPVGRALVLLMAVLLGAATTTAAVSLRAPEPAVFAARSLLERQIKDRTDEAAGLREHNQALSDEIAQLQATELAAQDPTLLAQIDADNVAAGSTAVTGPGLRVSLADAPADASGQVNPDNRVQDVDLQIVVNSLWLSGSEAVAINGQRLTSLTAIRSAGSAILVDLVPLTGPYTVDAIGDQTQMQTRFARTPAAPRIATLRTTWGIGAEVTTQSNLRLPGAGALALHFAATTGAGQLSGGSSPATATPSSVASSDSVKVAPAAPVTTTGPGGGTK
jgi:uncharacterized protein YlxW (UPF0749 family)